MKFQRVLITAALLFFLSIIPALAHVSNTVIETDEAKVVRYTGALEAKPLAELAPAMRSWLISWAETSEDVTITVCDILGPIPGERVPHGPELLVQSLFGNASFQVRNKDKKNDPLLTQLAGVRSVLKAYSSIILIEPNSRIEHFDDLIKKDADGTLDTFMAPIIADKCSGKDGA